MSSKFGLSIAAVLMVLIVGVGVAMWLSGESSLVLTAMFQNEPFEVQVEFTGGTPKAGQTQHVHVSVRRDGAPFAVYANNYAIHLIVASIDHAGFLHTVDLHEDEVGVYGADVTFGPPGAYRVWVEVNEATAQQHHGEGAGLLAYGNFRVGGQAQDAEPQPRVFGKEAQTGPYTVRLTHDPLVAGKESEVRLSVHDAQEKVRALTQPEPNIYVIVGPKNDSDSLFIRHGHSQPAENGTTVVWRETFPQAGEYLLWTTVYLVGTSAGRQEAVEVPFVLTVGE